MKIDVHLWLTYALARTIGINDEVCQLIAWADQKTDRCTKAEEFGIQTQCDVNPFGNWKESHIQSTVLEPFHFIRGDQIDNPRVVIEDSARARMLVSEALGDPIRFGIALHAYQDTFSHCGFTGYLEGFNSCGDFLLPNVGHTDMKSTPDLVEKEWDDPRTGEHIINKERVLKCAEKTFGFLKKFGGNGQKWSDIESVIKSILDIQHVAMRIKEFKKLVDCPNILTYRVMDKKFGEDNKEDFIRAAKRHLGCFLSSI